MLRPILRPFQAFVRLEASSAILLFLCTIAALVWANSPAAASYFSLFQTPLSVGLGSEGLSKPLLLWINDGLMAVFFFLVGLEIKREFAEGDLRSPRQAALPIAAALGGTVVPAGIYAAFNMGTPSSPGWGVPMATDIAFALGVMTLLGPRVPVAAKLFLTVLAIVDDLAAVLVIAIFYTAKIDWISLLVAGMLWIAVAAASRAGMRSLWAFFIPGVLVWFAGLLSGVHATIAGVLMAFTIPAQPRIGPEEFTRDTHDALPDPEAVAALSRDASSPLRVLEHALHPWVAFLILPLFALANAGVTLTGDLQSVLNQPLSIGIILGLLAGKPVGIFAASWLAVKSNLAELPAESNWRTILGVGFLAGIGFTMALFIASLAFPGSADLAASKLSILMASVAAGLVGVVVLSTGRKRRT